MAEQHGKALVPQIRFAGFTDPWEQRKLGDVAAVYDGVHQTPDYQDEGVMFLSVENIATLTSQKFISREAFAKNYPVYPKHGDVLMTRIGDIGTSNVVETDDKLAFYVSLALLKPFDVDSYYLDKSLQSPSAKEELYRRTLHIAFPKKINKNQIAEVMLPIPRSRQEQEQIGALFRDLDSLITLHQRKYDKLCVLKKSMLDKMFPKGGSLYPEIRFAGFTDPWEQRKLGEVARRVTRKNENRDSDLPLTISAQYGLVDQRTFFNNQVASKDMSGYFLLRKGEFAYNKSTSTDSPWGAIKRLEKYDMGCVSTLYICFELLSGDPDFLVTYYETDRWYKAVQLIAAEGARNHGLLNIAPDDFFETQICIPKRIDEQRQIGAFFDRLDSLITLHQRKLELLRNIKKSMLDKMFV
ncbi:restriction endonuclease subunit S [Bifidobacterium adolescentis]|nr:restriction endonuclease subunit S [Bifidobacterium adolescentis]KAB5791138.1 restriction endonuclease subunit S [Bifidobacterium adolescentis]KAB5802502.1 restriction endonuclease subunit S [Bifidobacterium adolescentis]